MVGDMVFTKDQYNAFIGGDQRSAVEELDKRWTNGELQFKFHSSVTSVHKEDVRKAVKTFNDAFDGCVEIM